jgi:glycosyltransferase involved in cell wall biosynthesis
MNNGSRPHICFVAPHAWPVLSGDRVAEFAGGAEVQQCLIARSLAARGYRVSMICLDHGQPDLVVVDGVTVITCHSRVAGLPVVRFFHPRLTGIWSALRRADADVYYHRTAGATAGIVGLFARCYGRRFVYAAAADLDLARNETWKAFQRRAGWRDRQLYFLGLSMADAIIAQTPRQQQDCWRWYRREATLIRSASSGAGASCDPNGVILWVSTLRRAKRPELFLELARRLPEFRFRMVGGVAAEEGGQEFFARIARSAQEIPNLEFVGFVPYAEIETHFAAARLFVNTSDGEGFPNTFLQSWARGIPTVSFVDTGSMVDGSPVVTRTEDIDGMAGEVEALMRDDRYWSQTGARAHACYERFHSLESVVDAYVRIVDHLLSPASGALANA